MSRSTFVKSTLILTVATLLSKILGSIFRIPLQNIAGDEVLGIFSLVYPVYMVALYLSVAGIPVAISKLIAEARAKNNTQEISNIYRTASVLAILFGVISFTIIFSFSPQIAQALGGAETKLALIIVAATLLVAPYMAVYRGYFQGFENMTPTAVSQVIEQFIRVSIILIAAYYLVAQDYSNEIVAAGVMSGSIVGALLSLGYLRLKFSRSTVKPTHKSKYSFSTFKKYSKTILKISIPIAIGAITMAIINFVDSFTVPYGLRSAGEDADNINYLYGIYGRGLALVQIATVFATSIVLPLIPLITKKLAEKDLGATKEILTRTYFLTHLISWPAAFGLLALTLPLNLALFTNLEGSLVLAIIGFSSVFTSFTILGTGILQGMNKAKVAAYIILIGVLLKTILNILFIKFFGLEGAALSTLIIYVIIVVLNTIFIFKAQRFTFVNNKIGAIFLSSIIMGAIVGLPTLYFDITSWTRFTALIYVAAAIIIGAMVYFIQLYLFKVVDRSMLGSLPLIGKYVQKTSSGHSIKRKEEQPLSKKRILIWIATIVLLIVSIPGVMNRWNAEESNNAYEIIVPYDEILELTEDGSLTLEQALNQLKEAGLNSVSFNPLSLATLEERGIITIYDQDELKDALRFSTLKVDFNEDEEGFYITVPDQEVYVKKIKENFNVDEVMIGNEQFYFLSNGDGIGIESIIGYDEEIINLIKEYEMDFVLRMENADFTSNMKAISDVIRLKDENTGSILFKGTEVVGYPKIEQMKAWGEELQNAGYSYHSIEFTNQKGLLGLARDSDYNIVRLHSINIDAEKLDDNVEKVIRATKERNVRSIFAHVPAGDPKESLKATSEFISTVHDRMPAHFEQGLPEPIEEIEVASWVLIAVLLAGVLFTYLGSEVVPNQKLRLLAAGFMLLLAVAAFLTKDIRLLQVYGLIIAIGTSIFAVLSVREGAKSILGILIQFTKALGISIIGIYIMVGVLNGNGFISYFEQFRGVKLVYLVPLVFIAIYLFWRDGIKLLNMNIKYWHALVIAAIGMVGVYYIMRTGNEGSVSQIELMFRNSLEQLLYVRPRTKEFLIGFPLFVLALYVLRVNKLWGKILLVPGAIGFVSIMNTFTHLHIPLSISVLRTVYGVVFGFIIGLILIVIFKIAYRYISKALSMR